MLVANWSNEPFAKLDVAFSCYVYAVADNTIHILLMIPMIKVLGLE